MSVVEQWRDALSRYAESHRKTVAFGPEHPAVRAAKRYCDRTGATWQIGIGGRCELGKRALKQWGYELWQNLAARWAIILVFTVAILLIGFSLNASATITVLAVFTAALYAAVGLTLGLFFEHQHYTGQPVGDTSKLRTLLKAAFIVTVPVTGPVYLVKRLLRSDRVRSVIAVLCLIVAAGAMIVVVAITIMEVGWLEFLVAVLAMLLTAAVFVGGIFLLGFAAHKRQQRQMAKQAAANELRRNDVAIQHAARDSLDRILRNYYTSNMDAWGDRPGFPLFEEWRDGLEKLLMEHGYGWEDLLSGSPLSTYGWLYDEDYYWVTSDFVNDLWYNSRERQLVAAARNEQRRARARSVLSFVAATLFLAKSKVCPSVILPEFDEVKA